MLYRVKVDLAFPARKEALKAIEKAVEMLPFSVYINPGGDEVESGYIIVEQCYHDKWPVYPCECIVEMHSPQQPQPLPP